MPAHFRHRCRRARAEAHINPARWAIEIIDTGHGIKPDHLAQIFQPFFTTKQAGSGTGLGLAIVQETVRAHDGRITVESEPGKGTSFTIQMPAAEGKN